LSQNGVGIFEKRCTGSEPIVAGPLATNSAHVNEAVALIADDLFGGALNAVAVGPGKKEARCKSAVVQQAGQLWSVMLSGFNQCKTIGLKTGSVVLPSSLQTECMTPSIVDPKGKIAKTARKMAGAIDKRCAGQNTDALFPGQCTGKPNFAACVEARVECRVCRTLDRADGMNRDCDDGLANGTCPADGP